MDPASALGSTSAVLAFVSCIGKTISVARQLHNAEETSLEFQRLDKLSAGLHSGLGKLKQALDNKDPNDISASESSLLAVLEQCVALEARIRLAAKWVGRPQQSTVGPAFADRVIDEVRHWIKVSAASIRIVLKKPEFDDLKLEFDRCTTLLNTHLAEISRTDIIAKLDVFSNQAERNTTAIQDSIKDYADWSVAQIDLQLAANHNELLSKIESIEGKLTWSCEKLQAASHRLILEGIGFPDMDARLGHIEDQGQAEGTFEWLVNDDKIPKSQEGALTMSFRQWLSDNSQGIFHIAGKPGSGKSTLMRFLMEHPETRAQLRKWATEGDDESEPIVAAVFFWNAGSRSQKSMNGLYRTLLHSLLKSGPKDLVPLLFPERLVSLGKDLLRVSQGGHGDKIPDGEVAAAFLKLIGGTASRLRFCLFIDGADEFSDPNVPQWKLAMGMKAWVNSNPKRVKICVSSREEQPWLDHFNDYPRLAIHFTTGLDIETMIWNAIGEHPNFEVFDPQDADRFIDDFVRGARGVFLWVKLVLVDVVAMLDYKKDIEDLFQALKSCPPELGDLFDKIMRDKVRNNEETLAILRIMVEVEDQMDTYPDHLGVRNYSLVKDALVGKIRCGDQWPKEGTQEERDERVERFITGVPLMFGGLVAVQRFNLISVLYFSHRSIYEYLVVKLQQNSFDKAKNRLVFLQCLVAGMRVEQSGCGYYDECDMSSDWFFRHLIQWIATFDEVTQESLFPWLEEMEQNLFRLSNSELSLMAKRELGPYWLFGLSACCGLVSYAEWALSRPTCTSRWITTAQAQAVTLDYLVDLCFRFGPETYTYPDTISSSFRILLLETPDRPPTIDPNAVFNSSFYGQVSMWQYFIIQITINTVVLGVGYRGFSGHWDPYVVWDAVAIFLESGARPDIYISWSVDEVKEEESRSEDYTYLCLKDITVMLSDSPAQDLEGARTEHELKIQPLRLELLKKEMPNGGSLRDIFLLFGPKDRPEILKLLEAEKPAERHGAKRQRSLENLVEGGEAKRQRLCIRDRSTQRRLVEETYELICFLGVCQFKGFRFGFLLVALFGVGVSVLGYVLVSGMVVKG